MFSSSPTANRHTAQLRYIDLAFDNHNFNESASELAYSIHPKWREGPGKIDIIKFTDGITNTVSPRIKARTHAHILSLAA
jgi:hypothetical protein